MSENGEKVLALLVEIKGDVGKVDGRLDGVEQRLDSLETCVNMLQEHRQHVGGKEAVLEKEVSGLVANCDKRHRQISDQFRKQGEKLEQNTAALATVGPSMDKMRRWVGSIVGKTRAEIEEATGRHVIPKARLIDSKLIRYIAGAVLLTGFTVTAGGVSFQCGKREGVATPNKQLQFPVPAPVPYIPKSKKRVHKPDAGSEE